jgi:hypothetical protein
MALQMSARQIKSREFSKRQETILLLLGEKAGMRESVTSTLANIYRAFLQDFCRERTQATQRKEFVAMRFLCPFAAIFFACAFLAGRS